MRDKPVELASFHTFAIGEIANVDLRERTGASVNLMENVNRGIVAMALDGEVTEAWADWDARFADGTRIEVKSTGAIQAWPQQRPSPVSWKIPRTQGWVLHDGRYVEDLTVERRSDFYVLAAHDGLRPDRTDQWRFYVLDTDAINRELGDQKSIVEGSVRRIFEVESMTYEELSETTLVRSEV